MDSNQIYIRKYIVSLLLIEFLICLVLSNHDFNLKYFAKVISIRQVIQAYIRTQAKKKVQIIIRSYPSRNKKQVPVDYSAIKPRVFIFCSLQDSRILVQNTYPSIQIMYIKIKKQKKFVWMLQVYLSSIISKTVSKNKSNIFLEQNFP
ncbi:hypothetical protein ABPG74_007568 [Tetrahymena malaccensis]